MVELDLSHYSTIPFFNLKAVVQGTGVSAPTLRAWERRYGVPHPNRSDSNHRLYSERDIVLIRWLKVRVEAGMTISQAIEHYYRSYDDAGMGQPLSYPERHFPSDPLHHLSDARAKLFQACLHFDEQRADALLNELFALYSIEDVMCEVLQPTLMALGKQALRGEINKTVGYFALEYAKRKTMALMDIQPPNHDAPLVVSGCAPGEKHDLDILLFALFMRSSGWRLLYLGQNVPLMDLRDTLETLKPAMVVFSATTPMSALALVPVAEMVVALPSPRPLFAFSGYAFEHDPQLVNHFVYGVHLGGSNPQLALRNAEAHLKRHF